MKEIALCPGDAAGIGGEICAKALRSLGNVAHFHIFASRAAIEPWLKLCKVDPSSFVLHDSGDLPRDFIYGEVNARCGELAYIAVREAVEWTLEVKGRTLVTGCMNKESLQKASVPFIGHTEMIAHFSGSREGRTMFQTLGLRIFFLTRHVSLSNAIKLVTKESIRDYLINMKKDLIALGIGNPKIAVAGLNPHCGEHGLFGSEDDVEVRPGVEMARELGIDASGPIGADSVFHMAKIGIYDAVLSLYHDQGHIAAKTLDFDKTITMTLGLPFLRTSVDHGTAFDIAGKGIAREISMVEALNAALVFGT